jgi:DNA mismatch repair protein MSH3
LSIQDELYRIRDQIKIVSQVEWRIFCGKAKDILYDPLRAAICMLGNIDAILSLSIVAQQYPNYCKPEYPENSQLMIVHQGRHPMLERIVEDQGNMFLPNDVQISQQFLKKSCQVVTGPNMGGKSSYVRMIALIALLGQIGSYVPAEYASLCLFDNIFTRMGAEDDISSGKSTFMCELIRTNKILQNSTSSSLVIIDELGRGTATNDGQAIAEATLDHIIHRIGCATLFITHFQHLANLVESSAYGDQAFNSHMSFVENTNEEGEKEVVFLYKSVSFFRYTLFYRRL